jgi:hypothetical protein
MSIEVTAHQFLFIPSNPTAGSSGFDEFLSAMECDEGMAETEVPFSHNHLHDLESLWWVAVWVVFYHSFSKEEGDGLTLQDANDQLDMAEKLFPPVVDSTTRLNGFKIRSSFKGICNQLPPNKRHAHICLNFLRQQLISHYEDVEAEYPLINPDASTDDIYGAFTQAFTVFKSRYHDFALVPIQDIYAKLSEPDSKRPQSKSKKDSRVAQKNARK